MPANKVVLLIFAGALIALGYTNCSRFESIHDDVANVSSQCLAKLRTLSVSDAAKFSCDDVSAFECDRREFRPGNADSPSEKIECVSSARNGSEICVKIHVYPFDTEAARAGSDPAEFEPGGEYNRDEVQCMNVRIGKRNLTLIQAEDTSVEAALNSAIDRCYAGSTR